MNSVSDVSDGEVRATLRHLADNTQNQAVRQTMLRAIQLLDGGSLAPAATALLDEMARTKRLERQLLWLGPATILVMTAILFAVAGRFLKVI